MVGPMSAAAAPPAPAVVAVVAVAAAGPEAGFARETVTAEPDLVVALVAPPPPGAATAPPAAAVSPVIDDVAVAAAPLESTPPAPDPVAPGSFGNRGPHAAVTSTNATTISPVRPR